MAHLALADHPHLKASNVEFTLPRPNYTADTMAHMRQAHPGVEFSIIMGQDNLEELPVESREGLEGGTPPAHLPSPVHWFIRAFGRGGEEMA